MNVEERDPSILSKKMTRRRALTTTTALVTGAVAGIAVGGVAGYFLGLSQAPTQTITKTETVTQTATKTVSAPSTVTSTPTTPVKVPPIRFSCWDFHPERIEAHLKKFEEEYGIKVDIVNLQSYPAYQQATQSKLLAGETYDVMYAMTDYQLKWYEAGWVRTLEGLADADTIKKSMYKGWLPSFVTPEGELLSLPYFCAFYCVYYNKRIADENGFEEPRTKDDIYEQCKKLKEKGMPAPYLGWWAVMFEEQFVSDALGEGIELFSEDGDPLFEGNKELVELLEWYRKMVKEGLTYKEIATDPDQGKQFASFLQGNSYIFDYHHYFLALFNKAGKGPEVGNFKIVEKPIGGGKVLGFGGSYLLGKNPQNLEAAWEFMKFLGWKSRKGEWTVRDAWLETDILLSPYPEWFNRSHVKEIIDPIADYELVKKYFGEYTLSPPFRTQLLWYADWRIYCNTVLQSMVVGEVDPRDVPKMLADKARELKSA
ncbi:extracellular solute-binding protein [Candidatus Bathyarchaeota archaeon]|nr:extracellular solute-binding protein [Candidatus Bathyarchaeota archaeon]